VVVALVQVARERRARQNEENRGRTDRHLAHARLISAWLGRPEAVPKARHANYSDLEMDAIYNYRTPIFIHNSSAEPIYEVVTGIVFIQGAGGAPRTLEGMLEMRNRRRKESLDMGAAQQVAWGRGQGPGKVVN
jgi:hypothetical protein